MKANHKQTFIGLTAATALSFGALGCTTTEYEEDNEADPFGEDQGFVSPDDQVDYAPGPYGFEEGQVIPNLEFVGYPNFVGEKGLWNMTLADFYNPTGEETYPEWSPYGAGQPKPTALLVVLSAEWCGPCQLEAESILPERYAEFKPMGGQFLGLMMQDATGDPADYATAERWASNYDIDYALALDPTALAFDYFEPAFPGNMIIRTSDMRIISISSGVPQGAAEEQFWSLFESVVNGTYDESAN